MTAVPHVADGIGWVPIFGLHGKVRAWALVDPDVLPDVAAHRWHLSSDGYPIRHAGPRSIRRPLPMHRQVLGLPAHGHPHVRRANGDPLDNRRANLHISRRWVARQMAADPSIIRMLSEYANAGSFATASQAA